MASHLQTCAVSPLSSSLRTRKALLKHSVDRLDVSLVSDQGIASALLQHPKFAPLILSYLPLSDARSLSHVCSAWFASLTRADTPVFKLLVRNGSLPCSLRGSLWQTLLGTSPFFDPHYHRLVWTAEDLKGIMKKQTALTVSDLVEMFKPIAIRTDGGKRDQFDVASYLKPLDPTQSHELRFEFPLSPQSVDLFDDRSPRSEASPSPSDQHKHNLTISSTMQFHFFENLQPFS